MHFSQGITAGVADFLAFTLGDLPGYGWGGVGEDCFQPFSSIPSKDLSIPITVSEKVGLRGAVMAEDVRSLCQLLKAVAVHGIPEEVEKPC